MHEIGYLLNKITVEKVMRKDPVTVSPDMTVEEAVALAQGKKVGALVVVEGDRLVGIVTTNDFFYKVLNHILGIGLPGSRMVVRDCHKGPDVEKALAAINGSGVGITTLFTIDFPDLKKHDLVVHLDCDDCTPAIQAVEKVGFTAAVRAR
jgi:acetoin utilization protein AcuB